MTSESLATVAELLGSADRVLIFSHVNPDADAYGSSCGLAAALSHLGIAVSVFNESGVVPRLAGIPGVAAVQSTLPETTTEQTVVVVCDCGAAQRVGDTFLPWIEKAPLVVNIDHHTANTEFGQLNLIDEGASSTSEIIFRLLRAMEQDLGRDDIIGPDCAVALMSGIVGDTGSFRYQSTTESTFLTAAELVRRGAKPYDIAQALFSTISLPALKLQAEALSAIQLRFDDKFAEVVVTQEMVKRHGAELLDADSLAERARDIEGVRVSALFKQDLEFWRISLRSRAGTVDVSEIARAFGGGGHKPAAAFRWRKELSELVPLLRARIGEALAANRKSD